jgi:hypothetical protein
MSSKVGCNFRDSYILKDRPGKGKDDASMGQTTTYSPCTPGVVSG